MLVLKISLYPVAGIIEKAALDERCLLVILGKGQRL
jgi:hypothetical protein